MKFITYRVLLGYAFHRNSDLWSNVEHIKVDNKYPNVKINCYPFNENNPNVFSDTLTTDQILDLEFNPGYGTECPIDITVWTKNYIYYHTNYDGSDGISSINRNPPQFK